MATKYSITNKSEFVIFLQNMVKVLSKELNILEGEIEFKKELIRDLEQSIKTITEQIVNLQNEIEYCEKTINELNASCKKENSIKKTLEEELNELRRRIDELTIKINEKKRYIESLPWYAKALAYQAQLIIEAFTLEITNAIVEINKKTDRVNAVASNLEISLKKLISLKEQLKIANQDKIDLNKKQNEKQFELERCGKEKTKQEDFKNNIGHFKSRVLSLLDLVNTNIEFSDEMLNTKDEIIAQIKEAYEKYNRPLPDDLLISQSKLSSLSSVYSIYKISAL